MPVSIMKDKILEQKASNAKQSEMHAQSCIMSLEWQTKMNKKEGFLEALFFSYDDLKTKQILNINRGITCDRNCAGLFVFKVTERKFK